MGRSQRSADGFFTCYLASLSRFIWTHRIALEVAERYQYRIFDALVIAAALEASCTVIYSEDMQGGQKIRGLTIRNPFS